MALPVEKPFAAESMSTFSQPQISFHADALASVSNEDTAAWFSSWIAQFHWKYKGSWDKLMLSTPKATLAASCYDCPPQHAKDSKSVSLRNTTASLAAT